MELQSFSDIEKYLSHARQPREAAERLAQQVVDFLKEEMHAVHVVSWRRGQKAPGIGVGSCSRFEIYFDEGWCPSITESLDENVRFVVGLAISDRGPLLVGFGYERKTIEEAELWELGKLLPKANDLATAKAHSIAIAVCKKFDLTFIDLEWLRTIEIDPMALSEDAITSLDYSEPNALNILFAEDL